MWVSQGDKQSRRLLVDPRFIICISICPGHRGRGVAILFHHLAHS